MPKQATNGVDKSAAWKKAANKAKTTWKKAREAKGTGGSYEEPPIEDGRYVAYVQEARADISKNGNPFFILAFQILEEPYLNQVHRRSDWLVNENAVKQQRAQEGFAKVMSGLEYDVTALEDISELPSLAEAINKDRPVVEVFIKNWQRENSHGLNIYVNHVLSDEEAEEYRGLIVEDTDFPPKESAPVKKSPSRKARSRS